MAWRLIRTVSGRQDFVATESPQGIITANRGDLCYTTTGVNYTKTLTDADAVNWVDYLIDATVLSRQNQDMTASVTASDNDLACATAVAETPAVDTMIQVQINGATVELGDGSKVKDCYFSEDAGTTARLIADVEIGDLLYWNGSVVGYELAATDTISFLFVR